MKKLLTLFVIGIVTAQIQLKAQVAIATDGSGPDASAMLDIKSNAKGLLIPRMTSDERIAIPLPAHGLLVYDLSTSSFWAYNPGSGWVEIVSFNLPFYAYVDLPSTALQITNYSASSAGAGSFQIDNSTNSGNALSAASNSNNPTSNALSAIMTGGGNAGNFIVNNPSNAESALLVESNGAPGSIALTVKHTGVGPSAEFQIENASSTNNVLQINNLGLGRGALIQSTNDANDADILDVFTSGPGTALSSFNGNTEGNGTAARFEKAVPFSGVYTAAPNADVEIRHPVLLTSGMAGLRILNTGGNNNAWTFYTNNIGGTLSLFYNGASVGSFSTGGVYTASSDKRVKDNISKMPDMLGKVMQLQPKTYHYTFDKTKRNMLGFVAQDVEQVFPQIVYKGNTDVKDDYYKMDYSAFGVIAVKAIQEQQKIIEDQQKEINDLRQAVNEIKLLLQSK